ncbi:hypothetical protein [Flindersiella endophytica]
MTDAAEPAWISTRTVADLAKAGYTVLRTSQMQVKFEVHHLHDRPGYLRRLMMPGANDPQRKIFSESLSSSANGIGLVICARTDEMADDDLYQSQQMSEASLTVRGDPRKQLIFGGTARPNPTFLYESGERFEGLISMGRGTMTLTQSQSIAVRDLLHKIADVAVENEEPLLLLQNPVQLPTQRTANRGQHVTTRTEGRPTRSSPLAVRFAIALRERSTKKVLEISRTFREYCSERGYALWTSDSRTGYRQGNWFQICKYSENDSSDGAEADDFRPVEVGLPVTFVGPARVGSTYAILSFLQQFDSLGVAACSVAALADLAFVHLHLSPAGRTSFDVTQANRAITHGPILSNGPEGLRPALKLLGLADADHQPPMTSKASDYQLLVGPSIALDTNPPGKRISVWFSWQIAGEQPDLAKPLDSFYRALEWILGPLLPEKTRAADLGNIDYLICREVRRSVLRGKARISVQRYFIDRHFKRQGLSDSASNFCGALENAWRALVKRESISGLTEVTVSWRESWLGHWTSSL